MKSTVVDESLSSFKPMYCSREYQASTRTTFYTYFNIWPNQHRSHGPISNSLWLFTSLLHMMDGLLNCAGIITRNLARLDGLGLIGVDLICNKDIYVSISFIAYNHCFFNVCISLQIYCMFLAIHCSGSCVVMILHVRCEDFAKIFKPFRNKVCAHV